MRRRANAKLADTTQPPALSNHGGFYFSPQRKQIMIHIENINITVNAQALSAIDQAVAAIRAMAKAR